MNLIWFEITSQLSSMLVFFLSKACCCHGIQNLPFRKKEKKSEFQHFVQCFSIYFKVVNCW